MTCSTRRSFIPLRFLPSCIGAAFLLLSCCLLCLQAFASEHPPQLRLPDTLAPVSYRVHLNLDPAKQTFSGSVAIKVNLRQPLQTIWLNANNIDVQDASLESGAKNFHATALPAGDDFVGLHFDTQVPAGAGEINIRYTGKVRQQDSSGIFHMQDNGNEYIFTQFEQIDARAAFPCFDEPSYKVPWQLTLTIPKQDTAISNTPVLDRQSGADTTTFSFKETKPLPSYLVAFAVGPFDYVDAGRAGKNHVPVRIVTPKGHAAEAKYAAEVTATILTRLEDYFGIPYPYEKSDEVAIPVTFGFGAMENAGMVTYGQTIILARPDRDSEHRRREYASVAAHELAHQWFGDLVTTAWWNDIWLNEAFATWMERKIVAEWKPEWNTRVEDVSSTLGAEGEDSLISARKIRQEIHSKDDISNAFDAITYQKGAAVIGMFEAWVGPEPFRRGVQAYLKQYAFRNGTAPEFLEAVSSASGKTGLPAAFSTFLNQAGVPLLSVALDCSDPAPVLHLHQERFLPVGSKGSTDQLWQIPVCVRSGTGDSGQSVCTLVDQPSTDFALQTKTCPAWVEANNNAVGYYHVDYQNGLLPALAKGDVEHRLDAAERVDFMGNASALSSGGKLPAGEALGLVNTFHNDPERYVVESALDLALAPEVHLVPPDLNTNYRRFLLKNFQTRAHEIGWTPKPGEPDNVRLLRPYLLYAVATSGGDRELAQQARDLTEAWFKNHAAIDLNITTAVLRTAAYYGDKALFERFLDSLQTTNDRQERQRIFSALASFRDPTCIQAGMAATLSGKVPFIEGLRLLFAGEKSAATRNMAFDFMKAHFDEISRKRPTGGGFDAGAEFPYVGAGFCSTESKQQLQTFFEPRIGKFTGGPRVLSQVLETIDLCIAEKQAQEPSVAAFLKNY